MRRLWSVPRDSLRSLYLSCRPRLSHVGGVPSLANKGLTIMRTITPKPYNVYTFDELSPEAKERAIEYFQTSVDDLYGWGQENVDSLKAFADRAGFKVLDWSIGLCSYSYVKIDAEDEPLVESEWLDRSADEWREFVKECEDCKLTGYWCDGVLARPLTEALEDSDARFDETMQECVDAWTKAYVEDLEYTYSAEAIAEMIESNGYEFTEAGRMI